MNRMAETSRSLYNVEEVLNLLEGDPDDDEELDEVFFRVVTTSLAYLRMM